jgi:hypothetical protein
LARLDERADTFLVCEGVRKAAAKKPASGTSSQTLREQLKVTVI